MIPALNPLVKAMQTMQRLLECRATAKALNGASYPARVAVVMAEIRAKATAEGIEPMPAALALMKTRSSAGQIMWLSAAIVEITEAPEITDTK